MKTVDACTSKQEIDLVTSMLLKRYTPIYADIWRIGLNMSLRISDLLRIKYKDLDIPNRSLTLKEAKTGKLKEIRLNNTVINLVAARRALYPNDVWLFESHGSGDTFNPITRHAVSRVFKEAGDWLGLRINTHSMRKTRGCIMYRDGVPIEMISRVLNHSSPAQTMRYIGITRAEVLQTYQDYDL